MVRDGRSTENSSTRQKSSGLIILWLKEWFATGRQLRGPICPKVVPWATPGGKPYIERRVRRNSRIGPIPPSVHLFNPGTHLFFRLTMFTWKSPKSKPKPLSKIHYRKILPRIDSNINLDQCISEKETMYFWETYNVILRHRRCVSGKQTMYFQNNVLLGNSQGIAVSHTKLTLLAYRFALRGVDLFWSDSHPHSSSGYDTLGILRYIDQVDFYTDPLDR